MTASMPEIVRLSSPSLSLDLCPAVGGAIAAFGWHRPDGKLLDLLRPTPAAALRDGNVEGVACFPLTPFSNRLRDGRCVFRGRRIAMPLNTSGPHVEHGHGWQRPWRVAEAGPDHASLVFEHHADAWPFPYEMRQNFRLRPDRLEIELVARNLGDEAMPYGFGLHPYFPRTPDCTITASVAAFWETDAQIMPTRRVSVPAALDPGAGLRPGDHALDNVFTGWDGRLVIDWPEHEARLSITADGPLHHLVIYTPPGEPYFCAEPVSHCTDAFNLAAKDGRADTGMLVIEPAGTVSSRLSFAPKLLR